MMNKKNKNLPTIQEFNEYKPKRNDFEWSINEEGIVSINVPKFNSNIGKSFCKLIKKENKFTANLDRLGSTVWELSNGKRTVKMILNHITKKFPDEKNIDQRLYFFLQQMKNLYYIDF